MSTSTLLKYLIDNVLSGYLFHNSWHSSQKQLVLGNIRRPLVHCGRTFSTNFNVVHAGAEMIQTEQVVCLAESKSVPNGIGINHLEHIRDGFLVSYKYGG